MTYDVYKIHKNHEFLTILIENSRQLAIQIYMQAKCKRCKSENKGKIATTTPRGEEY